MIFFATLSEMGPGSLVYWLLVAETAASSTRLRMVAAFWMTLLSRSGRTISTTSSMSSSRSNVIM